MRGLSPRGSIPFRATQRSLRFAKEHWPGRSSTRAPVLRVSAPQPLLVSRSRRFRRARLSPDFAFSAWKAACPCCRLLSLRSSRGSGLTQRQQRLPRCLSRSVKPRSDRPPAKAIFQNQTCAERSSLKAVSSTTHKNLKLLISASLPGRSRGRRHSVIAIHPKDAVFLSLRVESE